MRHAWWLAGWLAAAVAACHAGAETTTSSGAGGASGSSSAGTGTTSSTSSSTGGPALAACNTGMLNDCNPYGIDLAPGTLGDEAYWAVITQALSVPYYRPGTIYLDTGGACDRCLPAIQHARKLVLVTRANGSATTPTSPPADPAAYRTQLGALLDQNQAAVAAVVIEDELDTRYSGTADEYLAELTVGCQVAHEKSTRCADGGVSSAMVVLLLADYYEALGNTGAALQLLGTAGGNPDVVSAFATWPPTTEQALLDGLATRKTAIDRVKQILAGERDAGIDFADFHWYETDPDTLDLGIAFMRNTVGCNAVMIAEMGQRGQDPVEATHKLDEAKQMGLPMVIWASGTQPYAAPAVDATGALLASGMSLSTLAMSTTCD